MLTTSSIAATLSTIHSFSCGRGSWYWPLPAAAVRAGLMPAPHDLRGHPWMPTHRVADHERGHLDAVGIEQVQDPGHPLAGPVLIKAVLPQVGKARQDRLRDRPASATDRLPACLKLHRDTHCQPGTARPEPVLLRHCCSPFPIRVHERFTKALRVESAPVRRAMLRVRR